MSEEKSQGWGRRILGIVLHNPVSVLCAAAIGYCLFQAFVLNNSPMFYKAGALGVAGFWVFLLLARHLVKLILLLLVVAALAYGWFWFSSRDKVECEAKGGYWNKNTLTCEEKVSFWDQLKKTFKVNISSK